MCFVDTLIEFAGEVTDDMDLQEDTLWVIAEKKNIIQNE